METDYLIIGGGVAGISVAASLAPRGTVLLLEAEPHLASHASGRSAALYEPNYGNPEIIALTKASGDFYHGSGLLSPRGMMLVDDRAHRDRFLRNAASFGARELSLEDARTLVPILNPDTVAFVGLGDSAWDIDTDALLARWRREALRGGAMFEAGARVDDLRPVPGGWAVRANGQVRTARVVINAAGAWADQVARMAGLATLSLTPLRRSMARIPAPEGMDVSGWPMIFGGDEDWYMKPDAGALIVSPADEDPCEPMDAWADDMVLAEGLARYQDMVSEPVTRLLASWAGLRTFAPDRRPVIGFDPVAPGFFWLAGQGGYGFQTAPAVADLAAALVTGAAHGADPAIVAALDPRRFH